MNDLNTLHAEILHLKRQLATLIDACIWGEPFLDGEHKRVHLNCRVGLATRTRMRNLAEARDAVRTLAGLNHVSGVRSTG
jgi:hypothetical protein